MTNKNIINNETQANDFAKNLYDNFNSPNYLTTPIVKGQNNFNFQIRQDNSSVKVVVYYGSKGIKIVLQGNKNSRLYDEILQKLNKKNFDISTLINQKIQLDEPVSYIGVDESGKGDFFGPLIIAGFYVHPEIKEELIALRVQDSKRISDATIFQLANTIKEKFKDFFSIVKIYPKRYNELYEKIRNLNSLLAWGHARCIENILTRHNVSIAICDQFGNENFILNALMKEGKQIKLIQSIKAERYLGVAAASILARNSFIEWIKKTEKKLEIEIPKGSNPKVKETARLIMKKFGKEILKEYVKIHFKTYKEL